MATSLQIGQLKGILLCGLLVAATGAGAGDCRNISSSFIIYHWQGGAPDSAVVQVISASGGTNREPVFIDYVGQLSGVDDRDIGQVLSLNPKVRIEPPLLAADDYRIVLGGKVEYLVHDIRMPERGNTGCPISSAMVNHCAVEPGRAIEIDGQCGKSIP